MRLRILAAAGAAVVVLASMLVGCGRAASPPVGTVADIGFRPDTNGFLFQNYGTTLANGDVPVNLTPQDVQEMFGDAVCADAQQRKCDLIPEAQAWLDETNQQLAGGHCYGFSVLSELLWEQKVNVNAFGATDTTGLNIEDNQSLQSQLAYDWALQLLPSVQDKRVTGSPNKILSKLIKVLKPNPAETYTIAFWKPDWSGGHAVTPYAVENLGGGQYKVLIYDNNWPGQSRAILFDKRTNSWSYDASTNPDEPDSHYEGTGRTETLSLYPTSPGLGTQPCPFCSTEPSQLSSTQASGNTEQIDLLGADNSHTNLVITDDAGRRVGYIDGKLVNEIPGAHTDEPLSNQDWTNSLTPNFIVPADSRYTLTIDGSALTAPDAVTAEIIGPSYDLSAKNINLEPGDKDTLVVEPDATKLSYTASRAESPILTLGVSDSWADYSFEISGVADAPGSTVNLALPAEGKTLSINYTGSAQPSSLSFKMTRSNESGVETFSHQGISLNGNQVDELQFGNWVNPPDPIPLVVKSNGQQSTLSLSNEAPAPST